MKIMFATQYFYDDEHKEFTKNNTGFGIMVKRIIDAIAQECDTCVCTYAITKGYQNVLKHTYLSILRDMDLYSLKEGIALFFKYPQSIFNRIKYLYYGLNAGWLKKAILINKPDIVHIHGIGVATMQYIKVCERLKQKYVVTLHGLIGLDKSITAPSWDKELEKTFLIKAAKDGVPVSVISTGMKKRIEQEYIGLESKNITVINNSGAVNYNNIEENESITKLLHSIKEQKEHGTKVLVFVGNITDNKNQIQLIRTYKKYLKDNNIAILLAGKEEDGGVIRSYISSEGLEKQVHMLGFCKNIAPILEIADLNIFLSKNDGFGLSIIEGYQYGLPCIAFADLDAIPDTYFEESMILIKDREDCSVYNAIVEGLQKSWNKEEIVKLSKKFTLDSMKKQYIALYKTIVS